jgi:HPt (histidine-containing phosphotransfer) domain-containing protein
VAEVNLFDTMKSFYANAGVPGFGALPLSADDLERKMAELRQVENWLVMNLNVLKAQLQVLEAQKQMVGTFKGFGAAFAPSQPSTPSAEDAHEKGGSSASAGAFQAIANPAAWMEALQTHMKPFLDAAQQATPKAASRSAGGASKAGTGKASASSKRNSARGSTTR